MLMHRILSTCAIVGAAIIGWFLIAVIAYAVLLEHGAIQ